MGVDESDVKTGFSSASIAASKRRSQQFSYSNKYEYEIRNLNRLGNTFFFFFLEIYLGMVLVIKILKILHYFHGNRIVKIRIE